MTVYSINNPKALLDNRRKYTPTNIADVLLIEFHQAEKTFKERVYNNDNHIRSFPDDNTIG